MIAHINLGIIEGRHARALEDYIDSRYLRQRKSYDEYYVDVSALDVDWKIEDLMILAERFSVSIGPVSVSIKEY